MRQTGLWTVAHCNCHGTIELYNWRRVNSYQSVVKRNNLPTVSHRDRFATAALVNYRVGQFLWVPERIDSTYL